MKRCTLWIVLVMAGAFLMGCGKGASTPSVTVSVSPGSATVILNNSQQFVATVTGATDTTVKWAVNDVVGGDAKVGMISTSGLYTAPSTLPSPATVTIKATSNANSNVSGAAMVTLDSGLRVTLTPRVATVGTKETQPFLATVSGPTTSNVSFLVNDVPLGNSTVGTIDATGLYKAPDNIPNPATVTVKATSTVDTNRFATATVTIVTAADPTLTAMNPTSAAQGSVFQDVHLTGTNFLSTSRVLANGTQIPVITASTTVVRARIPDSLLATSGTLAITVQRQSGATTAAKNVTVAPVRPALVGASPDSGTQGGGAFSINANGGYYGTNPTPAVTAEVDGTPRAATVITANSGRQLGIALTSSDLSAPGLVSVAVRNTAVTQPTIAPQQVVVTNLAVQPCLSSSQSCSPVTPPSIIATLPVGTSPGAVAINTATGVAVVANRGSNTISLIDVNAGSVVGGPIAVGTSPTGVAVDNVRNLALVANNGSNSISVVNLATGTVTATITSNIAAGPFSVGVNPLTGLVLVAYQSTNSASIIDLKGSTPAVVGIVSASTGLTPQVAIEPRLNWAVVTPGAAGTLTIANLGNQTSNAIAAAPTGTSRASNVVTITTTTTHGLQVGQPVLITGVADASFNGTFSVTTVPSSTSFTYAQTGANATSGGGRAFYGSPVATFTVGAGVTGIGLNPETEKAVLTDPTSTALSIVSVLDQSVTTLSSLEAGAVGAAANPLTDIAVVVNPNTNKARIIDPRTPAPLATIDVGTGPKAVAIDPGANRAVVVNETSNNVTILSLGDIRPVHVIQINLPPDRQITPVATLSSTTDLPITIVGKGFVSGSLVRLDGAPLPAPTPSSITDRQLSVTVPANFLAAPRRFALDVLNPDGRRSNATEFTVIQAVDVRGTGCAAPAPQAVAIDPERDTAVVTNTGCKNISLINLNSGVVANTISVGANPQGVAIISRLGKAVVTNRGDGTASIVDLDAGTVPSTVTVGTGPIGVAINPDSALAVVANSDQNTISVFNVGTGSSAVTATSDQRPVAVAIDPDRNLAVVANATQNNFTVFDISQSSPPLTARISGVQLPTGVVFDPVTTLFVATSSLGNNVAIFNPDTQQLTPLRVGINPTSLAYNFESSTLVTVNTASNTISVVDFLDRRVRAVLPLSASSQFSVAIHPRTNLAVVADQNNNRVLLVPLPR